MIGRILVLITFGFSAACMASSDEWSIWLRQVEQADTQTLRQLAEKINNMGDSIDAVHAEQLTTAISMALIKKPLTVINATKPMDSSKDPLKQRFGTSFICGVPGMNHLTQRQIEAYFARAEPVLKKAGAGAAQCLGTLRDTLDELRQERVKSATN